MPKIRHGQGMASKLQTVGSRQVEIEGLELGTRHVGELVPCPLQSTEQRACRDTVRGITTARCRIQARARVGIRVRIGLRVVGRIMVSVEIRVIGKSDEPAVIRTPLGSPLDPLVYTCVMTASGRSGG